MNYKANIAAILMLMVACMWPGVSSGDSHELGAITVTAQKSEENPQEIPLSLDTFSDIELEDAKVYNVFDLINLSSNISMLERSCEHIIVIRGISPFRGCTYAPAGFYVDEVAYPLHYGQNIELFDLQQVEILKGPQGTLYGRNTESGLIYITTKQPDNHLDGTVGLDYGSYNTFRATAGVRGPIVEDTLFLGLSALYKTTDGYVENIANGDDGAADKQRWAGRANLRWTPSKRWDISLIADAMKADDNGAEARILSGAKATDPHEIRRDTIAYLNQDWNSQVLRVKYAGEKIKVVSISSMLHQHLDKVNDADLWNDPTNKCMNPTILDEEQYTQEIRVSSADKGPWQWLVGLYGFMENSDFDYSYRIVSSNMIYMHPKTNVDTSGYAVFGQTTYTLFDRLHLTAGLRFDHQTMDADLKDEVKNVAYGKGLDFDEFLPKAAISFDVTDQVMAYASVAKGFLVGGYNWGLTSTVDTFCYDPEYTWNYEVGIKSTWLDGKLTLNLSVFHINISDKQVSELNPEIAATTITNAAEATSQGFELQAEARILPGLSVFGGFGYTDAQFDEFNATVWNSAGTALTEKDYSGNRLIYAPEYTYNLGLQYRHPKGLFARADLLGTGSFYGDAANTAKQDAYATLNLQAGYELESFDFRLWVKNVFDEQYLTFLAPYQQSFVGIDGPPRTIGASLTYRF